MDIERLKELSDCGRELYMLNDENLMERIQSDNQLQNYLSDSVDAIDAAIARQSVKSEDVAEAIEMLQVIRPSEKEIKSGEYPEVASALDLAITALQAYQPWIPVGERLPDDINEYLIVIKHKYECEKKWQYDVDVATSNGSYLNNFWDTDNDWDEGQEIHVTHWKPLPEPPKGE